MPELRLQGEEGVPVRQGTETLQARTVTGSMCRERESAWRSRNWTGNHKVVRREEGWAPRARQPEEQTGVPAALSEDAQNHAVGSSLRASEIPW